MVVIAGHICLDVIPRLRGGVAFEPGRLVEAGVATLSTGGAVSNVGQGLHRLGVPVRLIGRIGDDLFGEGVRRLLGPELSTGMTVAVGEPTSYTIVLNLEGQDRMFLHCPGCNDTFTAADVPDSALEGATHLHFGYPPLMARIFRDGGLGLASLFARARAAGLTTSLDMSLPDVESESGRVDWAAFLARVLPFVDLFLPSQDELAFMLPGVSDLALRCGELGAKVVGLKRGDDGLYVRSFASLGGLEVGEVSVPCFPVDLVGATGSGDATIAGFLMGFVRGFGLVACARAAVAVGACCCEAADAVSGIRAWDEVAERWGL